MVETQSRVRIIWKALRDLCFPQIYTTIMGNFDDDKGNKNLMYAARGPCVTMHHAVVSRNLKAFGLQAAICPFLICSVINV